MGVGCVGFSNFPPCDPAPSHLRDFRQHPARREQKVRRCPPLCGALPDLLHLGGGHNRRRGRDLLHQLQKGAKRQPRKSPHDLLRAVLGRIRTNKRTPRPKISGLVVLVLVLILPRTTVRSRYAGALRGRPLITRRSPASVYDLGAI